MNCHRAGFLDAVVPFEAQNRRAHARVHMPVRRPGVIAELVQEHLRASNELAVGGFGRIEVCSRRAWHGLCRSCLRFARVLDREDDAWWQRDPATLSKRIRLGLCSILSGGTIVGFGDLGEITGLSVARSVLVRASLW